MQREFEVGTGSVDIECLAVELRKKTAKEVFAELEAQLIAADHKGIDIDLDVLDMYLCILDEKDPVADDGGSFHQIWETFKQRYARLFPPRAEETT